MLYINCIYIVYATFSVMAEERFNDGRVLQLTKKNSENCNLSNPRKLVATVQFIDYID